MLFLGPDSVGLCKLILEGFKKYSGYEVDYIDHHAVKTSFFYKNKLHRTQNFFLKTFARRNLKHEHFSRELTKVINTNSGEYEMIFIIRPDFVYNNHLQLLRDKTKYFVAFYWDSVRAFPRKLDILHYFDRVFSYEPDDCRKYGFEFLPNFHDFEPADATINYDIYNLSTNDARLPMIEAVAKYAEANSISYLFKGFSGKTISRYIQKIDTVLPYNQMLEEIKHTRVILDIQKDVQHGLSFRPFEALGLQKKLITNNHTIKNYDFYNPQNIAVIDPFNISIPDSFFKTPYLQLPGSVTDKYHLKNWVHQTLQPGEKN